MNRSYWKYLSLLSIVILAITSSGNTVPEEGAQYDYCRWSCRIQNDKTLETVQIKVTIFNRRGEEYNDIDLPENRFSKIKNFSLRVMDLSGKVIATKKFSDMIKTCGFGADYQIYNDICFYSCRISYPKYPYSIEYQYTSEIKSLMYWNGPYFQYEIPVIQFSYELNCPADFKFDYKTYGILLEPSKSEEKTMQKWIWKADSVSAYESIDYAPVGYPERGHLTFRPDKIRLENYIFSGGEWSDIGRRYADLSRDCYLKPEAASSTTSASLRDTDPQQQMKSIYDEIAKNFRYVSVIIGISGWQPDDAALVEARGYGDCKALSTLLISRLRNAGFTANPVLVLTRNEDNLDLDFPSDDFNHVITMAASGEDTIWMDPTCSNCPFGEIPSGDENIPVLVVDDSGGTIVKTPMSHPEDNRFAKKTNIYMDRKGGVTLKAELDYIGNYSFAEKRELSHLDKDETKAYITSLLSSGNKKFTLQKYQISNLENREKPLIINLEAIRNRPSDTINEIIYLEFDPFESMSSYESLNLKDRSVPINLGYPFLKEQNIIIKWDSLLALDSIVVPTDDSAIYDFGEMHCRFERANDSVTVYISRSYKDYILPVDNFSEFSAFRDKLRSTSNKFIKFYRKTK
jgi:hypothetical protein